MQTDVPQLQDAAVRFSEKQSRQITCYAQHIEGCGKKFFAEICGRDLEGIVAKRKLSAYKDDANGWLKIKNRAYSQAKGRNEMMFPPKHPES
jgi:ATP-dependent DNA ligase